MYYMGSVCVREWGGGGGEGGEESRAVGTGPGSH